MNYSIIEQLSFYIVQSPGRIIEPSTIDKVKIAFIDTIASGVAGLSEPVVDILRANVTKSDIFPQGWLIGSGIVNAMPDELALINATICHAVDFDDTGASTQSHPSALLFPVLMSLSVGKDYTWGDLVNAYVTGLEIFNRLSKLAPFLHSKGRHPSSTLGIVAATAAGSVLRKLDRVRVENALAISSSLSVGLTVNFGTMVKPLHLGMAARNAVNAVQWAGLGVEGNRNAFDGHKNFFWALGYELPSIVDLNLTDVKELAIHTPGLNVKLFPSCSMSHRLISIAIELLSLYSAELENINFVRCFVTPKAKEILSIDIPSYGLDGKFSGRYLVSRALLSGDVTAKHFTLEAVTEPRVVEVMQKTTIEVHPFWTDETDPWTPDSIVVEMNDGRFISGQCTYPKGHANNPVNLEIITNKLHSAALEQKIPRKTVDEFCKTVFELTPGSHFPFGICMI